MQNKSLSRSKILSVRHGIFKVPLTSRQMDEAFSILRFSDYSCKREIEAHIPIILSKIGFHPIGSRHSVGNQ
jgi:hypothetical protein